MRMVVTWHNVLGLKDDQFLYNSRIVQEIVPGFPRDIYKENIRF